MLTEKPFLSASVRPVKLIIAYVASALLDAGLLDGGKKTGDFFVEMLWNLALLLELAEARRK